MTRRTKLNAYSTAQALLINADLYAEEKGREMYRFRFTRQGLRMISGWSRLSVPFLSELLGELDSMGWTAVELADSEFAVIQTSKLSVWPRLGWGRLKPLLRSEDPEQALDDAFEERFPDFESELSLED